MSTKRYYATVVNRGRNGVVPVIVDRTATPKGKKVVHHVAEFETGDYCLEVAAKLNAGSFKRETLNWVEAPKGFKPEGV